MKNAGLFVCLFLTSLLFGQHNNEFYNDGADVTIQNGAELYVMGDFHNYETTGLLRNNGFVEVQGYAISDNLFQQRGTGRTLMINNDVNAGETQYISGSYAVRGGQAAIGVDDGSFYNLELANDQGIVWLNGAGNIADVRNSIDFNGPGAPVMNRIVTHDPTAIPVNGSGYSATFGLMNPSAGLASLIDNTVTLVGNMSGTDNGYVQGNFRRAISPAGGTYNYVLGLEPAGAGAQRGMQYMNLIFGANDYDVISGYFQTSLDNSFAVSTECSGFVMNYWGGTDHGQWVMSDITGAGSGVYEARIWPQDDNFPAQTVWMVTKDNAIQGTADDCGPTPIGLDRAGFNGMGQFGIAGATIILPAELLNIWANPEIDNIEVGWRVGSELNLNYYELQRSEDGINFETIAKLDAVGTTQSEQTYTHNDYAIGRNRMYYYRYQSFDYDGYTEYSPVVSAELLKGSGEFAEGVLLYPNPTNGNLFLEVNLKLNTNIQLRITNSAGQEISSHRLQGNAGNDVFTLDANNWARGVYFVEITELRTGEVVRKKVVKN